MKRELARDWSEKFQKEIEESGLTEDIRRCMACGKCVGVCPVAAITPSYNPRQIIREVLLGNYERIIASEEIWRCFWCAGCASTCPSEIKYPLLMLVLRYYSLKYGSGKKYVTVFTRFVRKAREDGVTFLPSEKKLGKIKAIRTSIGLAPLRQVSEAALKEYQQLYDLTGTIEWLADLETIADRPLGMSFAANKIRHPLDSEQCLAGRET